MEKETPNSPNSPSITDPIKELLAEGMELLYDSKLEDGILKDVPILGSLLKGYKIVTGIKEHYFIKKINRFFNELESVSVEDKANFWSTFEGNEQERLRLGEQLIIYLDRHDTVEKSTMLARAFIAYIKGKVQKSAFLDLAVFIDSLQVHHLEEVITILLSAGGSGSGSFYYEINTRLKRDWFVPNMEVQRLLEYEDEFQIIENMYKGMVIKTIRKHRTTPLAQHFLLFVIPELGEEKAIKIGALQSEIDRLRSV